MLAGEDEFVKRRIYLPLERGRDIALRNLFRKVFVAGGFEEPKDGQPALRRTRVPVAEFAAALRIGNHADDRARVDIDEVECLLANLIYKVRYSFSFLSSSKSRRLEEKIEGRAVPYVALRPTSGVRTQRWFCGPSHPLFVEPFSSQ